VVSPTTSPNRHGVRASPSPAALPNSNALAEATAVNAYIASIGTEYAGLYNASGRAYPDVSAAGENVLIVQDASSGLVDGTSCSSPIFSSVIGLLNDQLLNAGKPVLGFLNPWLYANPTAFNDITTGSNPGCGTTYLLLSFLTCLRP
jgi:tripeptidyl-peptidase-1